MLMQSRNHYPNKVLLLYLGISRHITSSRFRGKIRYCGQNFISTGLLINELSHSIRIFAFGVTEIS